MNQTSLPVNVDPRVLALLLERAGDPARACQAILAVLVARHDASSDAILLGARAYVGDADADVLFERLAPSTDEPAGLRAAVGPHPAAEVELHHEGGLSVVVRGPRVEGAARIAAQVARLCEGLATSTEPVLRLPILGAAEEARLRALTCVDGVRLDEVHPTVVALFERRVAERPDAVAVVDGARSLTYAELDAEADRLAGRLGTGGVVALFVERSADAVIAFLAIEKALATYVPIDVAYPAGRVDAILEVARPRVILTRRALAPRLEGRGELLFLDEAAPAVERSWSGPTVADDAYAIFTSGSTGRPKGVLVDHHTLANYIRAAEDVYGFRPEDRVLQGASLGFDLSLEEIIVTLTTGATLVIRSAPPIESVQTFLDECEREAISILSITSALWHEVTLRLEDGTVTLPPRLRLVILGADAARPDILAIWQRITGGAVRLVNSYGLTETTIVATTWEATQEPLAPGWRALPVGTPLRNTSVYVVDEHDGLVPLGVAGEVCIGGLSVSRAYLGDDEMTAKRFVADPFLPGGRMYRTGDRGMFRVDGALEFLGRSDYQLKVNGVRIELGEIEARLRELDAVTEGIVVARKSTAGETELEAYVMVSDASLGEAAIRAHLHSVLPAPTVPARIVTVERFPLTAAGKIDRRALAELARKDDRSASFIPGSSTLEATVLAVVAEVLGVAQPGMTDRFTALGGTSLSAVRAASILGRRLGREVKARQLLRGESLREVCAEITQDEPEPPLALDRELDASIVPVGDTGSAPLARVFLTGATGYYGTFVLAELLAGTQAHVVCLVRAADADAGRARLARSLARFDCVVPSATLAERVTVLAGDLAEPRFGLAPDAWTSLADDVDAIFHVGAAVNLLLPYSALRSANVAAVVDVLRLATTGRPKSVHHVSTVEVLTDTDPAAPDAWLERPASDSPARLKEGYGQSKWVAEKLVEQARARGIRAFVHRPGRLMGHSRTGAFNPEDFLVRMLDACARIGAAPSLATGVDVTPVDWAARALVRLAELEPASPPAFHYVNRHAIAWDDLVGKIDAAGYPLRLVPHAEWCALLAAHAQGRSGSDFLLYLAGMVQEETEASIHGGPVGTQTDALLERASPPVDERLVAIYCARLAEAGRFPTTLAAAE